MIRQFAIAASAVLMLPSAVAGSASPLPDDKEVGTWVLLPLKRIGNDGNFGAATVQVDARARKICYAMDLADPSIVTEIHLSHGMHNEAATSIVQLRKSFRGGGWDNCVELKPDVARAILAHPPEYFVDVRTSSAGNALRARLEGPGKTLDR